MKENCVCYTKSLQRQRWVNAGYLATLPLWFGVLDENDRNDHLQIMSEHLLSYYRFLTDGSVDGIAWILSPVLRLSLRSECLSDIMTHRRFQVIFKEKSVSRFWCEISNDSSFLGPNVVTHLLSLRWHTYAKKFLCYEIKARENACSWNQNSSSPSVVFHLESDSCCHQNKLMPLPFSLITSKI
jgi:hypothetical protein